MNGPKKLNFGVLGSSRVAQKGVLPAIKDSGFVELGMVGSRIPEKSQEIAGRFGAKWGRYEDVLMNKDIDAVYISLPNSLHEEWSIKVAEAGKHILCEKPAALSYASAKRMVDAAKKNGVRLLEGLMFRYHPQNVKVREFIKDGILGELLRFDGVFGYAMPDRSSNAMNKELGGGSFNDEVCYPVSASRMVFGEEPLGVLCNMVEDPESGVNVKTDMMLYYPNGKIAFASSIFGSYYQSTYSVLGTKAHLRMGRAYAVPRDMGTKIFLDKDDKVEEIPIEPADHFRAMFDDFAEEILRGSKGKKDYEGELLAQAKVLEAARKSHNERRLVHLSEIK